MKPKIGIYGRMNVGKSSLLNRLLGSDVAIVSAAAGTTTDPVRRAFEILDFAPVIFIDTAGFDDTSSPLGRERVAKTVATLAEVDLAILLVEGKPTVEDEKFLEKVSSPYIVVDKNIDSQSVISLIKEAIPLSSLVEPPFFGSRLQRGDSVIMVCPIDSEAPSGRLILPQVQAIRAALDVGATAVVVQPDNFEKALAEHKPQLVVIDSQVFAQIFPLVPRGVELTSFSILLAELKGDLETYKRGLEVVTNLNSGDRILMIEHCSHQTSCDDIARVKIPRLFEQRLGKVLEFDFTKNLATVNNLSQYRLVIQCGGCMTNRRAVISNIEIAKRNGLPITNYGMAIKSLSL